MSPYLTPDPRSDFLSRAVQLLADGNPSFDQILWNEECSVLSFRRIGDGAFVSLWLDKTEGAHIVDFEAARTPAGSRLLWKALI